MRTKYKIEGVRVTLTQHWVVSYIIEREPQLLRNYVVRGDEAQDELAAYMFFKQLMERLGYETVTELQDA